MADKKDVDINKKFEDLLFVEENAQRVGYKEGFEVGKQQLVNGFHFGYHKASSMGAQLGYYCGVLEQYLNRDKCNSKKAVFVAKQLLQDIYSFPKFNDQIVDVPKAMNNIKFKYAKFCSLIKICSLYPEADKLDF